MCGAGVCMCGAGVCMCGAGVCMCVCVYLRVSIPSTSFMY